MFEYSAFLTVVPQTVYCLDPGGQFPIGSSRSWYSAATETALLNSMAAVSSDWPSLMKWFQKTSTISGFTKVCLQDLRSKAYLADNGHSAFRLACAYALGGKRRRSQKWAKKAAVDFARIFADNEHTAEWSILGRERSLELVDRLQDGTFPELFAEWRRITCDALKLPV